ncbi:MAG TPA: adenylate/guanylate cyclase domain-containing protein [Solirubrobacterales bacterium]|nr:adenylate/guanylate cyclase domain-containing protein [Solirubrobacterales bacterium]
MYEATKDDAERKQVTVLFADVSGSMDLAEQEDPEEWRKIMQRFFSLLADTVTRFEGTVDKFTGDGIMAIFGAPVAHEDHAARACYAALQMLDDVAEYAGELRRAKGLNFSTRIGINSGEVVAGAIGDAEGSYTAIGHTVGLAQRMEALAEPGKAFLTEQTAELARGFLDLRDLGEFEIKGASRPVQVFELDGLGSARSRLDLSRERGFSRFVGREEDMAQLDEALEHALAAEGAAVAIVAEPGIGKSRLSYEFSQRVRQRGVDVYECQGQAHGREVPFMPVLQMLRSYFGIADADPDRIVREKIAGRALLLDPLLAEDLPLLFDFLGVTDPDRPLPQLSAEARQRALRAIVCKLVRAPNRRDPILTVIEDLHWMDEASEVLLGELVGAVEGTKTMVLVNYRPDYQPAWKPIGQYRRIELTPLQAQDTAALLRDLAGSDPSLDGLSELIHERTAGNPFFIEEIVRELVESGHLEGERGGYRLLRPVEGTGVPASVEAVLAARIDRLAPEAKRLLQVASVIGKEVSERMLGRAAGKSSEEMEDPLGELVDAGFLYEAELYPEVIFAFSHPLTREVAFGSQLQEQRAAIHAATARAMAALNPDRHEEMAALIASHFEEGNETLEAARWFARAGYWAGHSQPHDALRLWRKVTDLSAQLEEGEEALALAVSSRLQQLDYAWRLGMDREEEARLGAEAEELAERCGDIHSLALLRLLQSNRPGTERRIEEWVAGGDEARDLAEKSGDLHLMAAVRAATSYAYMCNGDFQRLDHAADELLELVADDPTLGAGIVIGSPAAWALMCKGVVARERGDVDEAERRFEATIRTASEHGDPETASWTRGNLAILTAERGAIEAALALARRNCELTERLGDVFSRSLALVNLCATQLAAGQYAAALDSIDEAERIYEEAMGGGGEVWAGRAALRANALVGLGRAKEAIPIVEEAAENARRNGLLWPLPRVLTALGRARRAAGANGAEEALVEAADVAERTGALACLAEIESEREALASTAERG